MGDAGELADGVVEVIGRVGGVGGIEGAVGGAVFGVAADRVAAGIDGEGGDDAVGGRAGNSTCTHWWSGL